MRPHKNSQLSRTGRSLLKRLSMQLFHPAVIRIVGSAAWCLQWFSYRDNMKNYKQFRHFEQKEILLKWTKTDFTYCKPFTTVISITVIAGSQLLFIHFQNSSDSKKCCGWSCTESKPICQPFITSAVSTSYLVLKVPAGATFCSCSDTWMLWRRLRFFFKI